MVRIGLMARAFSRPNRRGFITGFGASALTGLIPGGASAQGRPTVTIQARRGALDLRPGGPETPVWMLAAPELRFRRGDNLQVEFANDLTVPVGLDWRGIGGGAGMEAVFGRGLMASSR